MGALSRGRLADEEQRGEQLVHVGRSAHAHAATVNACEQRSGESFPAVTLMSSWVRGAEVINGRLPYMVENVYTGLLVVVVAALAAVSIVIVVRLFRGDNS